MSKPMCYDELKIHADMLEFHIEQLRDWCHRLRRDVWIPETTKPEEGVEVIGWIEAHRIVEEGDDEGLKVDASESRLVHWEQGVWWVGAYIGEGERVTHWMHKPTRPVKGE